MKNKVIKSAYEKGNQIKIEEMDVRSISCNLQHLSLIYFESWAYILNELKSTILLLK